MKRIGKQAFAALLSLALLAALCACRGPASERPEASGTLPPAPSETASPAPGVTPSPAASPVVFTRENLPRLDGSTATVPMGRAMASVLLGESAEQVSDLVKFSTTTESFRQLAAGNADLLVVAEPNAAVYKEMADAGFEFVMEPFAVEGLVFMVNEGNPIDSLTVEEIQGIYSGRITNWKEVGGEDREIIPFQREEDAGSQALLRKLVISDDLMTPPASYVIDSMMGLMEAVRSYDNSPGAIGYSVYYYAHDMEMAEGLKIIAVDGVQPSKATLQNGSYPFRDAYYVVMAADTPEDSMTSVLYHWVLGEDGQKLADLQGYVPVLEVN